MGGAAAAGGGVSGGAAAAVGAALGGDGAAVGFGKVVAAVVVEAVDAFAFVGDARGGLSSAVEMKTNGIDKFFTNDFDLGVHSHCEFKF